MGIGEMVFKDGLISIKPIRKKHKIIKPSYEEVFKPSYEEVVYTTTPVSTPVKVITVKPKERYPYYGYGHKPKFAYKDLYPCNKMPRVECEILEE